MLRFSVLDTGLGLSPASLSRLFAPFAQADDASPARRFAGCGLGLSISRRLTEAMGGGALTAASDGEGCGSTFSFTVPLVVVGESDDAASASHAASRHAALPALAGKHVVVASPIALKRAAVAALVLAWGAQVRQAAPRVRKRLTRGIQSVAQASNGDELTDLLSSPHIDLLLFSSSDAAMCAAVAAAAAAASATPSVDEGSDASTLPSSAAAIGQRLPPAVVLFAWPPSPVTDQAAHRPTTEGLRASHRASFDAAAPPPPPGAAPALPPLPRAVVAFKPLRVSRLRAAIEEALQANGGGGGDGAAASLSPSPTTSEAATPPTSTRAASAPPRLSALLVEDDRTNAKVVSRMLDKCGCDATVARDGPSALEALLRVHGGDPSPPSSPPFDVVFMDLNLPGMDGDEVVAAARRDAPGAALPPIVAMSGEARWATDEERAAAGFVDSLPKPFSLEALRVTLRRVVGGAGTPPTEE